ncbi:ammonium transporter family [Glaciihabitans tibetensis]|uniref:Ammonium transporter n=1 Tax=Glaciihabitans tibetensis TaxID=1266600 RepID=A0A2T0VJE1_9MICO|nr:ammonium transporter [Glaciihabitans tibetensis]PRY70340.1 ammonium transporter family [Glaciihabitans tibetensis]
MPVLAALAWLACITALAVLYRAQLSSPARVRGGRDDLRSIVVPCVVSAVVWVAVSVGVTGPTASPLRWPVAALAALAGLLIVVGARGLSASKPGMALYGGLWSALVFSPAAILVFYPATFGVSIAAGVWDLGGALPVHVAAGAAALALQRRQRRAGERPLGESPRAITTLVALAVLWVCWLTALVGMDMAIDRATPTIVLNGMLVPVASVSGWLIVVRIRRRRTTLANAGGGLVAGLVAATAVGGSLGAVWAVALGLVVGVACASGSARSDGLASSGAGLGATHLTAAAIGLVWVGLFGDGGGFIYTGQFSTVQVQIAAAVAVAGWGYGVTVALSPMLRRRFSRGDIRHTSPDAPAQGTFGGQTPPR